MSAFNHRGMGSEQRVAAVFGQSPGVRDVCFVQVSARRLFRSSQDACAPLGSEHMGTFWGS